MRPNLVAFHSRAPPPRARRGEASGLRPLQSGGKARLWRAIAMALRPVEKGAQPRIELRRVVLGDVLQAMIQEGIGEALHGHTDIVIGPLALPAGHEARQDFMGIKRGQFVGRLAVGQTIAHEGRAPTSTRQPSRHQPCMAEIENEELAPFDRSEIGNDLDRRMTAGQKKTRTFLDRPERIGFSDGTRRLDRLRDDAIDQGIDPDDLLAQPGAIGLVAASRTSLRKVWPLLRTSSVGITWIGSPPPAKRSRRRWASLAG